MTDIVLREGQKLSEEWLVEYTGRGYRASADRRVECRIVNMYHSTVYGGANGHGKTVDEARLNAVLGLARAICDDATAFRYDADEIMKGEQLRWWQGRIQQEQEELELLEEDKPGSNHSARKKIERRIKLLEQLQGEWQEEHDYWPEEAREAPRPSTTPAALAVGCVSASGVAD
jgi:hypothetical protein